MANKFMRELRCTKCRALLAREYIRTGRLEIKCHRCGRIEDIECKNFTDYDDINSLQNRKAVQNK